MNDYNLTVTPYKVHTAWHHCNSRLMEGLLKKMLASSKSRRWEKFARAIGCCLCPFKCSISFLNSSWSNSSSTCGQVSVVITHTHMHTHTHARTATELNKWQKAWGHNIVIKELHYNVYKLLKILSGHFVNNNGYLQNLQIIWPFDLLNIIYHNQKCWCSMYLAA